MFLGKTRLKELNFCFFSLTHAPKIHRHVTDTFALIITRTGMFISWWRRHCTFFLNNFIKDVSLKHFKIFRKGRTGVLRTTAAATTALVRVD